MHHVSDLFVRCRTEEAASPSGRSSASLATCTPQLPVPSTWTTLATLLWWDSSGFSCPYVFRIFSLYIVTFTGFRWDDKSSEFDWLISAKALLQNKTDIAFLICELYKNHWSLELGLKVNFVSCPKQRFTLLNMVASQLITRVHSDVFGFKCNQRNWGHLFTHL